MWFLEKMEVKTLCYIDMQIICKLAIMHVHEYVKHYNWFWGKIPIVLLRGFLLSFLNIWKSFELFIIFKYHLRWQKLVLYIVCIHGNTLINTNILYDTTICTCTTYSWLGISCTWPSIRFISLNEDILN